MTVLTMFVSVLIVFHYLFKLQKRLKIAKSFLNVNEQRLPNFQKQRMDKQFCLKRAVMSRRVIVYILFLKFVNVMNK